jgi:hypothetical protein
MAIEEARKRQDAARAKVTKLMAIYNRHPDTEEGRSARAKADRLREQYGLDSSTGDAFLDRLQAAADAAAGKAPAHGPRGRFNRNAFGVMAGAFKSAFPGQDDEDYSKYAKGHRVVDKEEDSDNQ